MKPRTLRAAKRSLLIETDDKGRFLIGSKWMPIRVIANDKQVGIDCAMRYWLTGDFK